MSPQAAILEKMAGQALRLSPELGHAVRCRPATIAEVQAAEQRLGLVFPSLLRDIYLHVANGGFGPGYGLLGVAQGAADDNGRNLEESHLHHLAWCQECGWNWPPTWVPLIPLGCGIYLCVDCSDDKALIHEYDPNGEGDETDPQWLQDALRPTSHSLLTLMDEWLRQPDDKPATDH